MTSPTRMVLAKLGKVRKRSGGWIATCPGHDDREPSLSVGEGEDGRVLLNCHAGCDVSAILDRLGLTERDLFADDGNAADWTPAGPAIATYEYHDADGRLVFGVCRTADKQFRQWRPDPSAPHGRRWNLEGVERVPYRLSRVLAAVEAGEAVYVVEGEKDVHAVEAAGGTATTNPGGAGKWRDEYSSWLRDARVVVVADLDEPGRAHSERVARSLSGIAASVEIVEPAVGKDVADHLDAGRGLEELAPYLPSDSDPTPERAALDPFVDWNEFWARDRREAEWVYPDVLAKGRGHALYASHKAGKSLLMLHVAATLATGPDPLVVVYLDYEMGQDDLYERLDEMGYGPDTDLSRLRYALLPALPPLDTADGARAVTELLDAVQAEWVGHHVVVIFDTTARAVAGEENSADTFRAFYTHTGIQLKRRGVTWARLDHAGKDPSRGQRGSSSKGDDVDVVWKLVKTENGVTLRRDVARMSWVPEKVTFAVLDDPLRFRRAAGDWPAGTQETADLLDQLDVALDAATRTAAAALKQAGEGRRMEVVRAALKWRRERVTGPDERRDPPPDPLPATSTGPTSGPTLENRSTKPRTHPRTHGDPPSAETRDPRVPPYGDPGPESDDETAALSLLADSLGAEPIDHDPRYDDLSEIARERGAL